MSDFYNIQSLLEESFVLRNLNNLDIKIDTGGDITRNVVGPMLNILQGQHTHFLESHNSLGWKTLIGSLSIADLRSKLLDFINTGSSKYEKVNLALECLCLGVAYLELYCQCNYTGPELPPRQLELFCSNESSKAFALESLECDGNYVFPTCQYPEFLLVARVFLALLAEPSSHQNLWKQSIYITESGEILRPVTDQPLSEEIIEAMQTIRSATFWSARAATIHSRLIQNLSCDEVPTLWGECSELFARTRSIYGLTDSPSSNLQKPSLLGALVWLEWGLCCHYFNTGDKGKSSFRRAQLAAGLDVELTAALGKRSKYQREDIAQLLVATTSSLATADPDANSEVYPAGGMGGSGNASEVAQATEPTANDDGEAAAGGDASAESSASWIHGEWELGRRVVMEAEGGEEAAAREVLLDQMDGGAQENIIIEGGPQFKDPEESLVKRSKNRVHVVDQCILLALCLDVRNSNPEDGLTNEQMLPYIERVLNCPLNWMVHSTALLQRSWLEFERRRTADRAMLQIQALLDQHTSKLTITQASRRCIEEAAPVQDRMAVLYALSYPAQYELKKDLAHRYLKCQVFQSALLLFRELELWDEVVTCYQLMSKPHRAEMVVRERLRSGESPYMLTALGDLTSDEALYERAWMLSKKRYARAKRTLARACYDRNDWRACISHLEEALVVQPLVGRSWFLMGLAAMHLEDWETALTAFTRCVHVLDEDETTEAWMNIGAVRMRRGEYTLAIGPLTQASKQSPDNWKILENLLTCCLEANSIREAVIQLEKLLQLRNKSGTDLYITELRRVIQAAANQAIELSKQRESEVPETLEATGRAHSNLIRSISTLLEHCALVVPGNVPLWDLCAVWANLLGDSNRTKECRLKQFRAATTTTGWEKSEASLEEVVKAAKSIIDSHVEASSSELYTCKSLFSTAVRKAQQYWNSLPSTTALPTPLSNLMDLEKHIQELWKEKRKSDSIESQRLR